MNDQSKVFVDHTKAPDHIERLVEAILDGDSERAIDILCERHSALVSYQHQRRLHSTITSGRAA